MRYKKHRPRMVPVTRRIAVFLSWTLFAASVIFVQAQRSSAQSPPGAAPPVRDGAGSPGGQGASVLRGRVIDAATGQPLYRTRVGLSRSGEPPLPALTAFTGDDGRFELRGVPAGAFSVAASRAGYLPIRFGQRRPGELGQTVAVGQRDTLEDIDIAMFKGGVLAGRVLDEENEPGQGVRVEALALRYVRGGRSPVLAGFAVTNDLGEFRIANLEPGTYSLNATSIETWGDVDAGKPKHSYAPSFYPGVMSFDRAQSIGLSVGQEVNNLDFPLVVGRAARISGVVRTAGGQPVGAQPIVLRPILLSGASPDPRVGGPNRTARTAPDGSFSIEDVPPGEYRLTPGNIPFETMSTLPASVAPNQVVGTDPFVVLDTDLLGLAVTLERAGNVAGSVVVDEGATLTVSAASLRVLPMPRGSDTRLALRSTVVSANREFLLVNFDGSYLFRLEGLPENWIVKAVRLNGRDITDVPFTVPRERDTLGLQLVISPKAAKLEGELVGAGGAPEANGTIVVFPDDEKLWGFGSRFVKAVRPDRGGRFTVTALPAGSYLIAAKDYVADGQWEDPDFLRTLKDGAVNVQLREDIVGSVKVSVAGEPGR